MNTIIQFTYQNEQCVGRFEFADNDMYYIKMSGGEVVEYSNDEIFNIQVLPVSQIINKLVQQFSKLVFRRAYSTGRPSKNAQTFIGHGWSKGQDMYLNATKADKEHLKNLQKENCGEKNNQKNKELQYRKKHVTTLDSYSGMSNKAAMRFNDPFNGYPIAFNHNNYFQYDVWNGDFIHPTREEAMDVPIRGDLLCGVVRNGPHGLYYERWFKVSEQFLKLWTIVMDPLNKSIERNPVKRIKRLQTANFTTWCIENKETITNTQIQKRFHRSRYECDATLPDVYVWIGMMAAVNNDVTGVKNPVEGFDYLCSIVA